MSGAIDREIEEVGRAGDARVVVADRLLALPGQLLIAEIQPAGYTQGINSIGTGGGTVSADQFETP